MIDVAMAVQMGRWIPPEVLTALASQGLDWRLLVSTRFPYNPALARQDVVAYTEALWVLVFDNDLILPDGALLAMKLFLMEHADFAAIAIPKGDRAMLTEVQEPVHVDAGPVLWRGDVVRSMRWKKDRHCECRNICDAVRRKGWRIGFLPGFVAAHVPMTQTLRCQYDMTAAEEIRQMLANPDSGRDAAEKVRLIQAASRERFLNDSKHGIDNPLDRPLKNLPLPGGASDHTEDD